MAISTVEFAERWERWTKDQEFTDTSPQAFAKHLEAEHAVQQVAAIRRIIEKEYEDKADAYLDIETVAATEYGDEWVNTFLLPVSEIEADNNNEWPDTNVPVTDDPDYVID